MLKYRIILAFLNKKAATPSGPEKGSQEVKFNRLVKRLNKVEEGESFEADMDLREETQSAAYAALEELLESKDPRSIPAVERLLKQIDEAQLLNLSLLFEACTGPFFKEDVPKSKVESVLNLCLDNIEDIVAEHYEDFSNLLYNCTSLPVSIIGKVTNVIYSQLREAYDEEGLQRAFTMHLMLPPEFQDTDFNPLEDFDLPELLDLYKEAQYAEFVDLEEAIASQVRYVIEDIDNDQLEEHYGNGILHTLSQLGFLSNTNLKAEAVERRLGIKLNEEPHRFGDRTESLSYLQKLTQINGGKISWHEFLEKAQLTEKNKSHYEFFRRIFQNQKGHIVTQAVADRLREGQPTKEFPVSFSTYNESGPQNTTRTEQLVIKLDIPEDAQKEIDSDNELKTVFDSIWNPAQSISGHPGSFGWVRVSLLNKHSWLIDEIQSDVMYGRFGIASYRKDPDKLKLKFPSIPEARLKAIDATLNRLFGDWHKVLLSSVLEAARKNSVTDLYMMTPEEAHAKSQMAIGSNKSIKIYETLPQAFHFTKKEVKVPIQTSRGYFSTEKMTLWHRVASKVI